MRTWVLLQLVFSSQLIGPVIGGERQVQIPDDYDKMTAPPRDGLIPNIINVTVDIFSIPSLDEKVEVGLCAVLPKILKFSPSAAKDGTTLLPLQLYQSKI